ncbi:MAG: hypothetical protein E4G90_04545 [Gemmatimonadales bacterium]|nr:MAG: hypothetical protein E4G90_04545 [Gemmatimonadales bacterium]
MRHAGILALSAVLFACGGGSPEAGSAEDRAIADAMGAAGAAMPMSLKPIKLEERDVERFISVLEDFERLGVKYEDKVGPDPSAVSATIQGLGANAEAMNILRDHDLDAMKFQQLTMSVMMAAAASEMENHAPDPAVDQAQLEQMKATLPPEQYQAMMKARQSAAVMMEGMNNQPEGNVELVARYREAIDAIGKKNR